MPIHAISRCSNTLFTSNMDVGCSQWGFSASTMTPQHHIGSAIHYFFKKSPPHVPIHGISRCYIENAWEWETVKHHGIVWWGQSGIQVNTTLARKKAGKLASYVQNGRWSMHNHRIQLWSHFQLDKELHIVYFNTLKVGCTSKAHHLLVK